MADDLDADWKQDHSAIMPSLTKYLKKGGIYFVRSRVLPSVACFGARVRTVALLWRCCQMLCIRSSSTRAEFIATMLTMSTVVDRRTMLQQSQCVGPRDRRCCCQSFHTTMATR